VLRTSEFSLSIFALTPKICTSERHGAGAYRRYGTKVFFDGNASAVHRSRLGERGKGDSMADINLTQAEADMLIAWRSSGPTVGY
jgi:hypothetical protein